jgi:hypothetical protein
MKYINIQKESTEFLRLQALGNCSSICKKRLTKLQPADSTQELVKKLYLYLYDLYFGISRTLEVELNKLENFLNDIRSKVSECEKGLVDYIWMVVHGDKNHVAIRKLERHYNSTVENIH